MLYLVGMGLWDERDLTLKGLDACKTASKVYLEGYTSKLMGMDLGNLERLVGKRVEQLRREDLEGNNRILEEAKEKDVVLLVGGDPLVATTHQDIILRAREMGIQVRLIHNASIVSAIAETGLHIYKFGQTVTIPFWTDNFKPTSFYDKILKNLENGLHTLVLLDIGEENKRYMSANEGLATLLKIDKGENIKEVIVVARLGSPDQVIRYGPIDKLVKEDFGPPLHSLVIPGRLHDLEKVYLESL